MGLKVLAPAGKAPADKAEALRVDIVAVHGLSGDLTKTWTHPTTKAFWLQDFLPQDVPAARVMTFGYNADAAFGNTAADIADHALSMLSSLVDKREEEDVGNAEAHHLYRALARWYHRETDDRYKNIYGRTVGIIFLGTPHRGSEKASYANVLTKVASMATNSPTSKLVSALQSNSDSLMRLTSNFKFQLKNYNVVSFFELRPTKPLSTLIVEKHSALLEVDGEDQIPVDANHSDICKFAARESDTYEKLYKRVLRMLKAEIVAQRNIVASNVHYEVPHSVSSLFTGREELSRRLLQACLLSGTKSDPKRQRRFVIYGLGGSGKTQVCLKFAQDNREKFWGIFWVDASSNDTAEQSFVGIASALGLQQKFEVTKRWLSNTQERWLLIIDNADDPRLDISRYFPAGERGTILITTRNRECKIHATVGSDEFGKMPLEEAITLLLRATYAEDTSNSAARILAQPVVETLGCLALAIVQAGAVIRQGIIRMGEYCSEFARRRKQLLSRLDIQASSDYNYTVYTTWEVSMGIIEKMSNETSENAIELLRIFSFFHFEGISEIVFNKAWTKIQQLGLLEYLITALPRILRQVNTVSWDPLPMREAVNLLTSFSLITIEDSDSHISMHPLVHTWVRDRLTESEQRKSWMTAVSMMWYSIPAVVARTEDLEYQRYLLPHIDSCLSSREDDLFTTDHKVRRLCVADRFATLYGNCGRLEKAMALRIRIVDGFKATLGDEHRQTLTAIDNLAMSYYNRGQYQKAVNLVEHVLEVRKRMLPNAHEDTLQSMDHLGTCYNALNRWEPALKLHKELLSIRERTLGEEHPDTLTSIELLSLSLKRLGQHHEAVKLYEKVLKARRQLLGEDHPDTSSSTISLACSYLDLGRCQEALTLLESAVKVSEKTLGKEHPMTLYAMSHLTKTLSRALGRVQEAANLQESLVCAEKRVLGEEHPNTILHMQDLAEYYNALGHHRSAVDLQERVVELSKKTAGEKHLNTLIHMEHLVIFYIAAGKHQSAVDLQEHVVELSKKTDGEKHLNTLIRMDHLAIFYSVAGKHQSAVSLQERVVELSKKTDGEKHLNTLIRMDHLVMYYTAAGKHQSAVDLQEHVVELSKKTDGEKHLNTLIRMDRLAISYSMAGKNQSAVDLQEHVVELSKKTDGEKHLNTLIRMDRLAISYSITGKHQSAVDLQEYVVELSKEVLGEQHMETLRRISNLTAFRLTGESLRSV